MKKPSFTKSLIALLFFFSPSYLFAQTAANACSSAPTITSAGSCSGVTSTVASSTLDGTATTCQGTAKYDVWYKFVAQSPNPTISLSGLGTNFTSPALQILDACGGNVKACGGTSITPASPNLLTVGSTYYVRILSTTSGSIPTTNAGFTVCILDPPPANDNCVNAVDLPVNGSCSPTSGTLSASTVQSTAGSCGAQKDVWYKFTVPNGFPTGNLVTVTVSLTNTSATPANNLTTSNTSIELFSAIGNTSTCASTTSVAGGCQNISAPRTFTSLTAGNTYYIRVNTSVAAPNFNATFNICVAAPTASRMNEVFKQTIIDNGTINKPWEITYGPDGYLWVTGSQDYKAYRIDPNTGTKTTIVDISRTSNSAELTATEHTAFNVGFSSFSGGITTDGTTNVMAPASWGSVKAPWPQGGFAGLAIHPQFNSGKPYVYISYVRKYDSTSATNKGGFYFRNSLVRFTYSGGKLVSPVAICDTLPGSNDHNSQRIIIAPVGGVDYLFYGQGDMGAGQLNTQWRPNHAQDTTGPSSYEGKILRFNLEPDADAGAYNQWIPDDNPYNHGGVQSAIWAIGIRNNQGFAYNPSTGVLYGSSHGPYSDDEINIIERYKNYGHPRIEGYSWDGNYNGNSTAGTNTSYTAGVPFATNSGNSTLAPIGDEAANAAAINASGFAAYKEPLYSGYPGASGTGAGSARYIWTNSPAPGNSAWPSEAWSGLDIYTNSLIPGWKNSLLAAGMKWGRVLRLKLDATGTSIVPTSGADTVAYWQGPNGYRDIAFAPNGKEIFVSIDRTNASGPGGVAPPASVAACGSCIIKYTFLGYTAGSGNRSSIPTSIDVASGITGSFQAANKVVINAANNNNNLWVPITDTNSNVVAEINARGYNLDTVTTTLFTRTGASRSLNGLRYVNRNMTIKPQQQPADSVWIRLYISKAEFDQFVNDGGIGSIGQLKIIKNEDSAKTTIKLPTILVNTTISESFNGNSYVLQGTIGEFSSFYFSNSAIIPLPLKLLTFIGSLQNNTTLLDWETSNEVNTSKFLVERSTDGRNFQQIGTVLAIGGSSVKNKYSFTDYDVTRQSSSIVYYRLKMVDIDGVYTYSNVITITLPYITSKVALFPNPAAHEVTVSITTAVDGKVKWQLIDNTGRIVIHNTVMAKKGNNNVVVNVNQLTSGTYYLNVSGAGIDQKLKLEKL